MVSTGNAERRGRAESARGSWRALATILCALLLLGAGAEVASAIPPTIERTGISSPGTTSVTLEAELTTGGKKTTYHFEYDTIPYEGPAKHGTSTPIGKLAATETPAIVKAVVEGLVPGTVYHFRAVADNGTEVLSADRIFATYSVPLGALPEERAYEQASPVDKDGGDAIGTVPSVKAASGGGGITFGSTSGMPGGEGAQQLPLFLATRTGEGGGASWSTHGLLPSATLGSKARVLGWTPDFSRFFEQTSQFGSLSETGTALFERLGSGGPPSEVTPHVSTEAIGYAGSSADDSVAVFEATSGQLGTTPPGAEGRSNVYAWDGSAISLVNVDNHHEAFKGAFAGPYEWLKEKTSQGGAARHFYTQDERAVSADGSVFFTVQGSGHIYQRRHPTQPQSALNLAGECTEPALACTVDVSPSHRAEPDKAGERPRAFQAASADGKVAFFTSSEKLTDDANTGPEVQPPVIGRATLGGAEEQAEDVGELLGGHHAVGIAVQGEFIYWADTVAGTIGRAKLKEGKEAEDVNDEYVSREQIAVKREVEPGVEEELAAPRYVAVDGEHIYWTNAADGKRETGTIGRAKLGAVEAEGAEAECVAGASNPQGIAVNASHIYWGNAFNTEGESKDSIGRAAIDCTEVNQTFLDLNPFGIAPYGLALGAGLDEHLYFAADGVGLNTGSAFVKRIPLSGGEQESIGLLSSEGGNPRGVAVDGAHLYWASQGLKAIGRVPIAGFQPGNRLCAAAVPGCETEFLKLGGPPTGVARADTHLYWSENGEILPHPGNDLYRYSVAGKSLTDLTADPGDVNGAEVRGVLGASKDGSRLYFVANADLDGAGPASKGDCASLKASGQSGNCNLYLWEAGGSPAGSITFVARLDASGSRLTSDARDWLPTDTHGVFPIAEERTSQLNADGSTLLFASQRKLTPYDNEGTPELYLYRLGEGIACVSCNPTGRAPAGAPSLGSIAPSTLALGSTMAVSSHNLAGEGRRVFFETSERLDLEDTNGVSCKAVGSEHQLFPSCLDVYEWEAPGTASCTTGGPSYSPLDEGCLYLISSGKSDWASLFGDASASGKDVFFFTRQGLVGQDEDELLDVYDARVGGGIPSQSPPPKVPCESVDACHGPGSVPPPEEALGSANFAGPQSPKPKRSKAKKHHHHHRGHHHKPKRKQRAAR